MGDYGWGTVEPVTGSAGQIAAAIAAFADAGADHVQLVVDPITLHTIETLGEVLALLDA